VVLGQAGREDWPKPLSREHPYQSDESEEWRRRRRQLDHAENDADCEAGTKGEQHRAGRDNVSTHPGNLATSFPVFLPPL
jgi:hypothetical protein